MNENGPVKLSSIRSVTRRLARLTDAELARVADTMREEIQVSDPIRRTAALTSSLGLGYEAIRRTLGVELYDTQLRAASVLIGGQIAEMETGEGKTFAAAPAAIVGALQEKQVHVATPNAYLAQRDFELLNPAFAILGIRTALLPEQETDEKKSAAYEHEVIYGTGYEYGFDYLRGSLQARQARKLPLGQRLLEDLSGVVHPPSLRARARYDWSIVDEADNVLIDDACSPLILSGQSADAPVDETACLVANKTSQSLVVDVDYTLDATSSVRLTHAGSKRIHSPDVPIPVEELRRPWTEYIEQALRARLLFNRDAEYVVVDDKVQIVDGSTGRIFDDRTWNEGLHQAIEAKEGVPITNERFAMAQITRQRFCRLYEHLSGMTGTAVGCERELRDVYNTEIVRIPRRTKCWRTIYPVKLFATKDDKWNAIVQEVTDLHGDYRPVLIGTRTIAESELVAELLDTARLPYQLLNGRQDADEAEIVALAGESRRITIATNLAGRGTDIPLTDEAKQHWRTARGGLRAT